MSLYHAPALAEDTQNVTFQTATTIQLNEGQPDRSTTASDALDNRLSVDQMNEEFGEGGETRVLIGFDADIAGAIPRCGYVKRAHIAFFTRSYSDGPVTISPLTAPFDSSTTWTAAGIGSPESSQSDLIDEAPVTFDVTDTVRAIAEGAPGHGWALTNSSGDGWDFCSEQAQCGDEAVTADQKPTLVVEIQLPKRWYLACRAPDYDAADALNAAAPVRSVVDPGTLAFAQALESGAVGTYPFMHPLIGMEMEREVKGVGHYVEEMPMGGEMEVRFEGDRVAELVTYFESVAHTRTLESNGGSTELHDGLQVHNPLAEALNNETGEVMIRGYE